MKKLRLFIAAFMILIVLGVINSNRATGSTGALDSDGDGVLNASDNCPLTANPDQTDSNANGIGDVCDAPFPDGFAYATPQGVVQSKADNRLRPTTILAPDGILTFVWSNDAGHIDLTIEGKTFPVDIDLSDPAILAALDAIQAKTGEDMSALRAWIAQNPGRVLAVARGEQQPPPLTSISGLSRTLPQDFPTKPAMQIEDRMENYLHRLWLATEIASTALENFDRRHPELTPEAEIGRVVLTKNFITILQFALSETENCNPCGQYCHIPCVAGLGACFPNFYNPPCHYMFGADCIQLYPGATFLPDKECPGACYLTTPGTPDCCVWTFKETCDYIPIGGGDVTTIFFPDLNCLGVECRWPR